MAALLWTSHARNDAVRAELVATDLYAHIRLIGRRPHLWIAVGIVAFETLFDCFSIASFPIETHFHPRTTAGGNFFK
jgi:hypothetical protein